MTHYELLGVPTTATKNQMKDAYRKAALQHHPDRNEGREEQFKTINEAYEVLSDDGKRAAYNRTLPRPATPKSKKKMTKPSKLEDRLAWIVANDPNINSEYFSQNDNETLKPKPKPRPPVQKTRIKHRNPGDFFDAFERYYTDDYTPPLR